MKYSIVRIVSGSRRFAVGRRMLVSVSEDDAGGSKANGPTKDELNNMMHGRKNQERRDSVTGRILRERYCHQERLPGILPDEHVLAHLEELGLGSKKIRRHVYRPDKNAVQTTYDIITTILTTAEF